MRINQKFPEIDAHGFLERAFFWLNSEFDFGVFYAALELRFTFEKILIKHGFASTNDSKTFNKFTSQPNKIQKTLEIEFSQKIDLNKAHRFFLDTSDGQIIYGYYLPISNELFSLYGKLDKYLHAQWAIPIHRKDDAWRKNSTNELLIFAEKLIPHANPQNSLDFINIPNIIFDEQEIEQIETLLKKYW
jgi:hypothetical protein